MLCLTRSQLCEACYGTDDLLIACGSQPFKSSFDTFNLVMTCRLDCETSSDTDEIVTALAIS
uniref:Uncharacterized protein n=1 Tax=Arion vulgaris TaxID=1028688 RepID=A0A0B7AZC7_9EUPU